MRHTTASRVTAIGEVLGAPLSFAFYRIVRTGMRRLLQRHDRAHPAQATGWQLLDGSTVRKPFNLLALMTSAPRWNTHAVIALAGPLQVRHTLRIHTAAAAESAKSWTVVVHAEPAHHMVASIGPLDAGDHGPWRTIELPPGTYRLALRYYQWSGTAELPAVEVDGGAAVAPLAVPANANDFYHDLAGRSSLLYLCLHSYVCTLLRHRRWFPPSFADREYLPAGNPQTTFCYGFLPAGTRLAIELGAGLLDTHDVYFTAYNRASFPTLWYQLTESSHRTPPVPANGTYLIRAHRKTPSSDTAAPAAVRVHAEPDLRT
jgi:Family of unknown function (DUF6208)